MRAHHGVRVTDGGMKWRWINLRRRGGVGSFNDDIMSKNCVSKI